jgi:hypothetical protein
MSAEPLVTLTFRKIGDGFVSKCRKTGNKVERTAHECLIDGKAQKGRYYFVRCLAHDEANGPYKNTALANHAQANPNEWCKWCAPFFKKAEGAP